MNSDIKDRKDIELMVNTFCNKVRSNPVLGCIFNNVAEMNWETHLPEIYFFWASILLNKHNFSGKIMQKHITLDTLTAMTEKEFSKWL